MKRTALLVPLLVLATAYSSCKAPMIKGTKIPDTSENRAILNLIETYREAFERRDADALIKLASKKYIETNGTVSTDDDYDYDGLVQRLKSDDFKRVLKARLVLEVKSIKIEGDRAYADLHVQGRYQTQPIGEDGEPEWHMISDVNRMTFILENGKWKILSGM